MIKFLHLADIHLGMENYGKIDKKTGLHSRMADFLRTFDAACEYAIKNKIDFILFAGDAYKTRDPSPTYQREFAKRIKKLAAAKIFVVLLVGNHDLPNAVGKANTLDIYSALEVENVFVARQPEVIKFGKVDNKWQLLSTINHQPLTIDQFQIAALPWIPKTWLLSPDEYQKKEIHESYKIMSNKLIEKVQNLAKKVDKKLPCVFLGHLTIAGAQFGSEQKAYIGYDVVMPQDVLQKGPWQYVALGHLHKYQVLSQNPPVIYSGSIERVDFGEEKEKKGFVDCELDTNYKNTNLCKYKFIPLPARRFLTISCEIKEDEDPTKKILDQIEDSEIKDAVVKIKIKIPEEKHAELKEKEIQDALALAYYFAGIQKEVVRREREQTFENIESLSILEALEEYWKSKQLNQKRIMELKSYMQKLLEESN
ncbi:MAG: exonuclease SbcCD subunit D [Patescibacteria group bacterium]